MAQRPSQQTVEIDSDIGRQPGIDVAYYASGPDETNYLTLTGVVDRDGLGHGNTTRHQFGPAWDETLPEPRPAKTWIALTGYHEESGWSQDQMSGLHGIISDTAPPHWGYQESWAPDLSIPRNAPQLGWDAAATNSSRTIYGQI